MSALQDETTRKVSALPKATPGSYVGFQVNPSITALTPLGAVAGYPATAAANDAESLSINTDGLLDILSIDFSRALKDLAAVLTDLKRLSSLGDLPITYSDSSTLRIHFPGCDAETVERLCEELDIKRGIVTQDPGFDDFVGTEIALLFPFAPSKAEPLADGQNSPFFEQPSSEYWLDAEDRPEDRYSTVSEPSHSSPDSYAVLDANHWAFAETKSHSLSSPEDRGTMKSASSLMTESRSPSDPLEYHDYEGIYRFLAECHNARR